MDVEQLTDVEKHAILEASRLALRSFIVDGIQPAFSFPDIYRFDRLILVLKHDGHRRIGVLGVGESLNDQLSSAIVSACSQDSLPGLVAWHLSKLAVEIFIQVSCDHIPVAERASDHSMTCGVVGVEVKWNDAFALFDPPTILAGRFSSPRNLLNALCREAGLFESAWEEMYCQVWRQKWIHLCEGPRGTTIELSGSRKKSGCRLRKHDLLDAVISGASYLTNNQYPDGYYCYLYNALTGQSIQRPQNFVRAAGCAYAMASSVRIAPEELKSRLHSSARRAINAIVHRLLPWGEEYLLVPEESNGSVWGKLGAVALTAVSLLEFNDRSFHSEVLGRLLNTLKNAQRKDGYFDCYLGIDKSFEAVINFYPGEALLALVMSEDEESLECCRRAFVPYKNHFRSFPSSAFVGWHADVWGRLALIEGSEEYASFVFEQLDWLLSYQIKDGVNVGAFAFPGKNINVSSCVYTEAIIRGSFLAHNLGMTCRRKDYARAGMAGLAFCSRLQIDASLGRFLPRYSRSFGGVTGSLKSFVIRSDNVQHMMTMAQAGFEMNEIFVDVM